ncbi:hypothetical protein C8Q79DRAFT_921090 [Trametes meyenii]|nr:hypothetical protein C8Q79DRAFT_921090 [Trametes meyenii]
MATVSGHFPARHPSPHPSMVSPLALSYFPFPIPHSSHSAPVLPQSDPYYGHEETTKLCGKFVTHLFACPDLPPLSTAVPPAPSPPLSNFIAYALHRTRLHTSVTFAALYLLQRLKSRFPAAWGSSGHRLFISAFMIASKVIYDDTYSNKSWSIVGQGMFALRETNQMEHEMCSYLEWQLNINPNALKEFEQKVRRDFKGSGPYPTYTVTSPVPSPVPLTTPHRQDNSNAPAPSFTTHPTHGPSMSPPKYIPPPVPVHNPYGVSASTSTSMRHAGSAPSTPDTPESSMSISASPASSVAPPTPISSEDLTVRVAGPSGMLSMPNSSPDRGAVVAKSPARAPISTTVASYVRRVQSASAVPAVLKKAKCGDIFACVSPCVW